jgi:acyl dehydratase
MPLNRACVGKSYPPAITTVTSAAIEKYARACNDLDPRYLDQNVPGGIIAPPMFAAVVAWLPVVSAMTDPELGADLMRLLHLAQDMEFLAPMRPGEIITTTGRIISIGAAPTGETIALQLNATNEHGAVVNNTTFTALIRGRRSRSAAATTVDIPGIGPTPPLLSVSQTIDRDQAPRYAAASGDYNPIHTDDNVAKMSGLPGVVVHGLCTMAFTAKVIIDALCGGDSTRLKRLAVHFSRPVFPGDTITTKVWPAKDAHGSSRKVYTYETYNPEGRAVIRGGVAEIAP